MTGKNWCFTLNSDPQSFADNLVELQQRLKTHVKYICGQIETASTGQLHFQGYVQLQRSQRLSYVRNNISDQAHWEIQKARCNDDARNYCMKSDTAVEDSFREAGRYVVGKRGQGARNDIADYAKAIKDGASVRDMIESHPNQLAQYPRFYHMVRSHYKPSRPEEWGEFKVSLYVGPTGTGKTRKAFDDNPELFEVPISNGTLWVDGYDKHQVALIDDFAGAASKMTLTNTLKFLDRYIRQVPVKGAHCWWMPQHIIVTSNLHPRYWYKWDGREEHFNALARRFTEVIYFSSHGEEEQIVEDYFNDRDQWPPVPEFQNFIQ